MLPKKEQAKTEIQTRMKKENPTKAKTKRAREARAIRQTGDSFL